MDRAKSHAQHIAKCFVRMTITSGWSGTIVIKHSTYAARVNANHKSGAAILNRLRVCSKHQQALTLQQDLQ